MMLGLGKVCFSQYCLIDPFYLYLAVPLAIIMGIILWINFAGFKKREEKKAFAKSHRLDRIIFLVLRTIAFVLLLIAIATPYTTQETVTEGNPSLTILADNSTSFDVFNTSIAGSLRDELSRYFPTNLKTSAYGERSAIGDGILQNAEGDDHLLVISDGNNNYGRDIGDAILFSSVLNTTVHTLDLKPLKKDIAVFIDGPSQVIEQSETTFYARMNNLGGVKYNKLEVFVDGNEIKLGSDGSFNWRFSKGYHKITARILFPEEDLFIQNNIYYKAVKSLPRPKLLYVGERSGPLQSALERIYDVTAQTDIPGDLLTFDAVILNDLKIDKIGSDKVDLLNAYLSEKGKGAIIVGGQNSFDNGGYKGSYFESMLPVDIGVGKREREEIYNIFFIIDLSGSVSLPFKSGSPETVLDVEKSLMTGLINGLNPDDKIGIIGHTTKRYCVPQEAQCILKPIIEMPNLYELISQLQIPYGPNGEPPGTAIGPALMRVRQSLYDLKGSKNAVILSDGDYGESKTYLDDQIRTMGSLGIKVYTVGVGYNVKRDTLQHMAELGGGLYFEPDEAEKLKIMFIGDEEEQRCQKATSGRVLVMDSSHWITKGTEGINGNIGGYNLVVPKSWGRKLLATDCGRTILTAGRYGLGRIAVLSTDDGSKWSGGFYSEQNSKVLMRAVNWAIGDFTKDMQLDVRAKDTTLGKPTDINVISEAAPEYKGLEFAKIDTGLYSAKFMPNETGFYQILDATLAVNYNDEYLKIGLNPELKDLVGYSGGEVFAPSEIERIKNTIISMSRRSKVETINYRWPFIMAALIIFLLDILIRRIRQNINLMR